MAEDLPVLSEAELTQYNGQDGKPVYIAYKGKVYDLTNSKMWRTGMHMKRHPAGMDLTPELGAAPHAEEVFERFPLVATLKANESAEPEQSHLPHFVSALLERVPFLERHPHPMTVHFPLGFMVVTPIFALLYLITGVKGFEVTSVNTLGAGLLFSLVAIPTGFFTWWVNYMARPMKAVLIKIVVSLAMFVIGLIAFIWRLVDPTVLTNLSGIHIVYLLLVLSQAPLVGIVGWFGATLTFPLEKKK
ncbi:MAG TPA: DUF2231 domain-containing protein [Spirochaetia bacterium]|nr:DUF2231 domain-containing protein [Spirochaetia bacterium]